MSEWKTIETAPKDKRIIVLCQYESGRKVAVIACYCSKFTQEASDDLCGEDWCDYDENSDTYYCPEGWYEQIENWDDLTACAFDSRITPIGWASIPEFA